MGKRQGVMEFVTDLSHFKGFMQFRLTMRSTYGVSVERRRGSLRWNLRLDFGEMLNAQKCKKI